MTDDVHFVRRRILTVKRRKCQPASCGCVRFATPLSLNA
jgi:hypothetical protein